MAIDVRENIRTVSSVWRDARTGSLVGLGEGRSEPLHIDLHHGGLCRPGEISALARAIARMAIHFEPGTRSGPGDRRVMGRLLLGVGRAVAQSTGGTISNELVVQLVLPADRIAGVLEARLVERLSARPVEVGELMRDGSVSMTELRALAWIGVIRTARPRTPRASNPAPNDLALASLGEEALLSGVEQELAEDLSAAEVERLLARGLRLDAPFARPAPSLEQRASTARSYAAEPCLDGHELGPVVRGLVARLPLPA